MKRKKSLLRIIGDSIIFAVYVFITGCSTGVVPAGPDTYLISRSVSGFGTAGAAKAAVYKEANAWCTARGLVMVPVSSDAKDPVIGQHMGSADLLFRALKPGDPEIKRTNVESPDHTQRIQVR
ncbi:MAG TPA: hypothetical protein VJ063_21415 [Verrucomicrobiae bacterium]|nr:hypothetical protein [Verrucomicrobiae bacterium]